MKNIGWIAVTLAAALLVNGCEALRNAKAPLEPQPSDYAELESEAAGGQPPKHTLDERSATSPRKAYEIYRQAVKQRDFDACWRLMSLKTQQSYAQKAEDLKRRASRGSETPGDVELLGLLGLTRTQADRLSGKMFFVGALRRADARDPRGFERIAQTEFNHEIVWGDRAKVYLKVADVREPEPVKLVREGGVWRIDLTRPTPPTP